MGNYIGFDNSFDVTLLWENPSPRSLFVPQTISVNYDSYDYIWLVSAFNTASDLSFGSEDIGFHMMYTINRGQYYCIASSGSKFNYFGSDHTAFRPLKLSNDRKSIEFYKGYEMRWESSIGDDVGFNANCGSNWCIPYKIFGIIKNDKGKITALKNYEAAPSGTTASYTIPNFRYAIASIASRDDEISGISGSWVASNLNNSNIRSLVIPSIPNSYVTSNQEVVLKNGGGHRVFCGGYRYESSADLFRSKKFISYSNTTVTVSNASNWDVRLASNSTSYASGSLTTPHWSQTDGTGGGVRQFWGVNKPLWGDDEFLYDSVISYPSSKEIDFLYTSDIHCGWKDWGKSRWGDSFKVFSLSKDQTTGTTLVGGDVKAYQNKLIAANIPTYLLDCGDWSKTDGTSDYLDEMVNTMKGMNYFGITYGNWEFKWTPMSTARSTIDRLKDYGLMACNFSNSSMVPIYPGSNDSNIRGCKTIKVGDKKIGLIAIGYPSPNGFATYGEYTSGTGVEYSSSNDRWNYRESDSIVYGFSDSINNSSMQTTGTAYRNTSGNLYNRVQQYVSYLKDVNGFDYVIGFGHMDKYSDEDYSADNRFYSRAEFLIQNTVGLDLFIPAHLNSPVASSYTYSYRDGSGTGIVAPTCGGTMNSFGRVRINLETGVITCKLLQSLSDLTV